jgi:DNA-binding MarR family transcriptional regulator
MSAHAPSTHSPSSPSVGEACAYVLGEDGLARWSDVHADAWIGLLETHKNLVRSLDTELEAEYGLTLSALEVLGRLGAADGRHLRMSDLAEECGLSLSRISRIIDALQERGLVERRGVESDARAVHAHLTQAGLRLVKAAQSSHFAAVQRSFFERLSPEEIQTLARVFARFAPRAAAACTTSE